MENLPRVLPNGLGAVVQKSSIKTLPVFDFMSEHVEEAEMYRTFNMGIGMVWVVSKENADKVAANVGGYVIGELIKGDKEVRLA